MIRVHHTQFAKLNRRKGSPSEEESICFEFMHYLMNLSDDKKNKPFYFFHVANEMEQTRNQALNSMRGGKRKRMGVRAGVFDYVFIAEGFTGFLEAKAKSGALSVSQKEFGKELDSLDIPWCIFRSKDEGVQVLKQWRLLK